jgi:hypothetical protein
MRLPNRPAVATGAVLGLAAVVLPASPASAEVHHLEETHTVDTPYDWDEDGVADTCDVHVQLRWDDAGNRDYSGGAQTLWASTQIIWDGSTACDFFPANSVTLKYEVIEPCRGCWTGYELTANGGWRSYIEAPPSEWTYENISSEHHAFGQTFNLSIPESK